MNTKGWGNKVSWSNFKVIHASVGRVGARLRVKPGTSAIKWGA